MTGRVGDLEGPDFSLLSLGSADDSSGVPSIIGPVPFQSSLNIPFLVFDPPSSSLDF